MAADLEMDADSQDLAEVYDETNITEDGEDIAHPDMERDVFDVVTAADDADDDQFGDEDDDDFDPDQADEAELETMLEEDDGVDSPNAPTRDPEDLVMETEDTPAEFEGDSDDDGDTAPDSPPSPREERELDHGLEETFPASDPVSISPGAD